MLPRDKPASRAIDSHELRASLYEHAGAHFFACLVDGQWQGGWFRIHGGKLEVRSHHDCLIVGYDNVDSLPGLLRQLLTEVAHGTPRAIGVSERRQGQELVSASLLSVDSTFTPPDGNGT